MRENMASMRSNLTGLLNMNRKLLSNASVVGDQKERLAAELKKVKLMIGKAGNLRCTGALRRR